MRLDLRSHHLRYKTSVLTVSIPVSTLSLFDSEV